MSRKRAALFLAVLAPPVWVLSAATALELREDSYQSCILRAEAQTPVFLETPADSSADPYGWGGRADSTTIGLNSRRAALRGCKRKP